MDEVYALQGISHFGYKIHPDRTKEHEKTNKCLQDKQKKQKQKYDSDSISFAQKANWSIKSITGKANI